MNTKVLVVAIVLTLPLAAMADPTTYDNEADFLTATGATGTIDFENFRVGSVGSDYGVAYDVTGTATTIGAGVTVREDTSLSSSQADMLQDGEFHLGDPYNHTFDGRVTLRLYAQPGTGAGVTAGMIFDFDTPINAFGFWYYSPGTLPGAAALQYEATSIAVPGRASYGGHSFFGFTDSEVSFSSLRLYMEAEFGSLSDAVVMDDIRWAAADSGPVTPLPGAMLLGSMGLGVAGYALKRTKKHAPTN